MLNSEKKIKASRDQNKIILTLLLSENKFLNETKNHKLNGRSLKHTDIWERQVLELLVPLCSTYYVIKC